MSEYQFYEFAAIDRAVDEDEHPYPWSVSSRATITPRRWKNVYNWGDFRGSVDKMMECYDAHVYLTNWGSFRFVLAFPGDALSLPLASLALAEECFTVCARMERTLISWTRWDDGGSGEWVDGEGLLDTLLPIRDELLRGDYRSVYLGWLAWAAELDEDEDESASVLEPPVPPGLSRLTTAQHELIDQLGIPPDLLAAAAALDEPASGPTRTVRDALKDTPREELLEYLARVAEGEHAQVAMELNRLIAPTVEEDARGTRTVRDLLQAARRIETERRAREAAAAELQRQQKEAKRDAYLRELFSRAEDAWSEADAEAEKRKASAYDSATILIQALYDAYAQAGKFDEYTSLLNEFRERHRTKHALLRRFAKL